MSQCYIGLILKVSVEMLGTLFQIVMMESYNRYFLSCMSIQKKTTKAISSLDIPVIYAGTRDINEDEYMRIYLVYTCPH